MSVLSIRIRLILLVGLILVVGFLTTNVISFQVSKSTVKRSILQNELPLTSNNIYSEIQSDLLRPVFISSLMSNDTFVKDWLVSGEQNVESIVRYLNEIKSQYGMFTSFLISESTRNYYHFSGISQVISKDDPMDAWYFRVRDMSQPYEINVDFNQAQNNKITAFVNYRVLGPDGEFLGVTGTGLDMESVSSIIERYQDEYGRNIYFFDRTGDIKVRSGNAAIEESSIRSADGISEIADVILSTHDGYFEYIRDGETMLVTVRLIPELDWYVMVELQESFALHGIRDGFVTNLIVGLVIIIVTILSIAYTINIFQRRLETMATEDKLTGIANRQVFDVSLRQALAMHKRKQQSFAVILMDIDNFKRVNDTLGHLKGDEVICQIAKITQSFVRDSDLVCRWGGEEFIALINDCELENAKEIAEKLRNSIAQAAVLKPDTGLRVTVSLGVTVCKSQDDNDTILARADGALYEAKNNGRNQTRTA